jgi:single-stranded-DNA-specific exonuclease
MPRTPYYIDKVLLPSDITLDNVKSLLWLEPFGEGNKEPTFLISGAKLIGIIPMANNTSVKFRVLYCGKYLDIVQFRKSTEEVFLKDDSTCDFLVKLSLNTFNGRESITIMAIDYRLSGLVPSKFFSALDTYEKILLEVELPKEYYNRVTPSYDELKLVYSYMVRLEPIDVESLFLTIHKDNINYCKLRLSIDIFCELGLATFDANTQSVRVIKTQSKVDLESSSILRRLKTLC